MDKPKTLYDALNEFAQARREFENAVLKEVDRIIEHFKLIFNVRN